MDARSLRRAGTVLFVGAGQFAFFLVLAEIYYPGYDVSVQTQRLGRHLQRGRL